MNGRRDISPLFVFDDVWAYCFTKPFNFVKVMNHNSLEELESLRVFTAMRVEALESRSLYESRLDDHVKKLETYLFHLTDLKSKSETYWTKKTENQLVFYWNSPIAGRKDFMQLKGIDLEHAMVMFLYACTLREQVHRDVGVMFQAEGDRVLQALEAVKALKSVAGVFRHIHTVLAESTAPAIASLPNTPAELVPEMSVCFEKICLGEAQALVALRAFEKKSSPSVMATVHSGASDLFEEASLCLRQNTGKFNTLTDKLRRCLALNSTIQQIRAYQQAAEMQNAKGEPGIAVGYCQKGMHLLETCMIVAETDDRWFKVVEEERVFLESLQSVYDQDRVSVYYQPVADRLPRLSDGKILVETMNYRPLEKQPFL